MKPIARCLVCLATLFAAAAAAQPAPASPLPRGVASAEGFLPERLARIAPFVRAATDAPSYLGAVTLIARHGKIVAPSLAATRFIASEGFGLGGSVLLDVARHGRLGSVGAFGWLGAASTYYTVDRQERLIAILLLQHLPRDGAADLPKLAAPFYNLVCQALVQ